MAPIARIRAFVGRYFVILWAIFLLPTAFHLLFSRFGYSPTDDGFILAYSRRLLRLQLPHRDFISVRPCGSALVHLPELLFGPYTYWISRWVVWTQFGVIGAAWLTTMRRVLKHRSPPLIELSLVTIAMILGAHTFPMMAWHTIDGATAASAGIALASSTNRRTRIVGWLLLGFAPLCKQNFAIVSLAAAILISQGSWRERLWMAFPGAMYLVVIMLGHGLADTVRQLGAQSDLMQVGWKAYVEQASFVWGVCAGLLLAQCKRWLRGVLAAAVVNLGAVTVAHAVFVGSELFPAAPNFALTGCVLGFAGGMTISHAWPVARAVFLGFVFCWATSISIGYNTPAVAAGCAFLVVACPLLDDESLTGIRCSVQAAFGLTAVVGLVWFGNARMTKLYREPPASRLHGRLGGLLPGGRLLLADPNTVEFIADLSRAVAQFGGARYAIIPDFAGWWAKAGASNPLPLDWFYPVELPTAELRSRVISAVDAARGQTRIIVQKVRADSLASGFVPLADSYSPVVQHVRSTWRPVGETELFTVYE